MELSHFRGTLSVTEISKGETAVKERDENAPSKTPKWGKALLLGVNGLILGAVLYGQLRGGGPQNGAACSVSALYLAAGVGCFLLALGAEWAKYRVLLRASGETMPAGTAFGCAVLGKYYDSITPMGAGGQPFQMYYLRKRGFSAGTSGAVPIVGFLGLQFSFVLLGLLMLPLGAKYAGDLGLLRAGAWLGLGCYAFVPVCILLFSAAPKTLERAVSAGAMALQRLRILKDGAASARNAAATMGEYCQSMEMLRRRPSLWLPVLGLSMVFRGAVLSMPWLVLRAFGASVAYGPVFVQVVYISAAMSLIPTPGNAGAAEGCFYAVFAPVGGAGLSWAMLVWRGLCYYSWLGLGFVYQLLLPMSRRTTPAGEGSAQFIDVYYPVVDGVVQTVDAYARRLARHDRCCVVCPRPGGAEDAALGYDVCRVPAIKLPKIPFRLPLPGLSRDLARRMKEHPPRVLHAHSPFSMGHYALRLGRRRGIPVVATFHSQYYDDVLRLTGSPRLARWVTGYIVRFYERADHVWACSHAAAETLRRYGYGGEIFVMENGVDPGEARPEGLAALAEQTFLLPDDRPRLLFVGQQIWQKNLALVLDTCGRLKEAGVPFLLVVAGGGYDAEAIRAYADGLGLGEQVRFLGKIRDRRLLMGLYEASDLFFFPSLYDNAPLVLREAALAGLPALVVAGANAAEVIHDGVNGFTGPNDSGSMARRVREILAMPERARIGACARDTIPVSWDVIVARVARQYADLG